MLGRRATCDWQCSRALSASHALLVCSLMFDVLLLSPADARISSKQLSSISELDAAAAASRLTAQGLAEDAVSFYVADIPDKYIQGVNGLGIHETNAQYGFVSLGQLLSPAHDHWDTVWHQIDAWYNNQMMVSPLRSWDAETADIIFVPALFSIKDTASLDSFVEDARSFLPYLGSKPHLLVLNHAVQIVKKISHLLTHENSHLFVFVSFVQYDDNFHKKDDSEEKDSRSEGPLDLPHVIGCPQFSHVHWSQGSWQLRPGGRQFDSVKVADSKSLFAVESFGVRDYADRFAAFEDCLERYDLCTHLDYKGPADAVKVFEAYNAAWFVLHPRADFIARSAWFDTLLTDSIPVVFQTDYVRAVPFADVLDYDQLMVVIPEAVIAGQDGQNVVTLLWDDFNQDLALKRIEYIHGVRHVFQYMLNPVHRLVRWGQRDTLHPDDDAFTFTLKSVLRKVCLDGWLPGRCNADPGIRDE